MSISKLSTASAAIILASSIASAPANAGALVRGAHVVRPDSAVVRIHHNGSHNDHVYYSRNDRDDVVGDAPTTYVETRGRRTWVDAPFTAVRVHPRGVWVRAPFVNIYVPR